jgi:TetR/AcrR family acrAB operon transcriptional repressor
MPVQIQATGGKRERTRQALIDAAAEVIAEKGFDRTSLDEVARRAGMTRGAVYGNFAGREDLFLAVVAQAWTPIAPAFEAGATFKRQMQIFGEAVAAEARRRLPRAAAMAAYQLYLFTNAALRERLADQNAAAYGAFGAMLESLIPPWEMPMPAPRLVRVLDALTTGLMFTYFSTPGLITDEDIVGAFTALAKTA